jgi:hypothetical protein
MTDKAPRLSLRITLPPGREPRTGTLNVVGNLLCSGFQLLCGVDSPVTAEVSTPFVEIVVADD